ncbi:MAG: glycogen-binding domain-containing protein [Deferrisomatales bacterium]|nr:glycogen-binding domain-containing protein [Deferrisomatales bacterium]
MARPSKTGKRRMWFEITATPGSEVCVAGSFNGWDPTATPLTDKGSNGLYRRAVLLPPGRYEYKFVVNGTWCVDPDCTDWQANELGSLNSVLEVK